VPAAERVGVRAVGLGGFLVAASRLGGPDVGQLTMTLALVGLPEYQRLERRYATDGESAMETKTP
jgi:2-methylisocitrate lyase-like PEP mutase family enzyme